MSGIATAIIGSAVIGGVVASRGVSQSAGAVNSASRRAADTELQMYNQNRADLAPYREAGYGALGQVQGLLGLGTPGANGQPAARDLSAFYASPNYEFVRSEGLRGLTNSASARGGQLSGNALRGATDFSGNLASGEFNNYLNRLFSVAGLGGTATAQGVQAGQQTGTTLANIYTNQGNARASAYLTGAQGVNSAIQGGLQNWAFNTYMNRPVTPPTSGGPLIVQ